MALFDNIFAGANGVGAQLLDVFGVDAVFTHKVAGTYDPKTDTMTDESVVTKVVRTSPILKFTTYEIDKLGIQAGECKLIGKGHDFVEITDKVDTVTVNGSEYLIVEHKKTETGSSVAIVTLRLSLQG